MSNYPSREQVESIVRTYHQVRGPERGYEECAKACGYNCGKSLRNILEKYAPFYNIPVSPRRYESMTPLERHRVKLDMAGHAPVRPTAPHPQQQEEGLGEAGAVLDTFVAETSAAESAAGIKQPKGQFPVPPAFTRGDLPIYYSRPDNSYVFGACGDTHLGSKYCRYDVLDDIYSRFNLAEVDCAFHAGNWIDGYLPRINHYDVEPGCHDLEGQLRNLVTRYPKYHGRQCIEMNGKKHTGTFAVTGDDHEGWWARNQGFDIGDRAQDQMRKAGRNDWHDLGYMESHIRLVNSNTGKETIMSVVHPGGGTSYAVSYHPQKYIESLEGGEKPAVVLFGHLHKLAKFNIRNVWMLMTGCTQDATPFIRLRVRQEVHVGAMIVQLEQDPETGAIVGCGDKMLRYFVRGYYNNRWNKSGPVNLPSRTAA